MLKSLVGNSLFSISQVRIDQIRIRIVDISPGTVILKQEMRSVRIFPCLIMSLYLLQTRIVQIQKRKDIIVDLVRLSHLRKHGNIRISNLFFTFFKGIRASHRNNGKHQKQKVSFHKQGYLVTNHYQRSTITYNAKLQDIFTTDNSLCT